LMAAWRAGPQALPRAEAESVAADLALALGYQRLEFAAREQARDLAFARQILSEGRGAVDGPEQLRRIVSAGAEQAGVGFICVGHVQNSGKALPAWCGPSPEWAAHLDSGPLAELWRRALITGQMTGCEHPAALPAEGFVRWAALPVRRAGNVLGVLVAGLRPQGCTLATLEGLELRAALAADFLAEWTTEEQKAEYGLEERERVEASPAALVLLDESNAIAAASPSARQLLAAELNEPAVEWLRRPGSPRLGRQLTVFPRPAATGTVRRDGVYGLVRHPMYGGVSLLLLAWALASSPAACPPWAATTVFLDAKRRREETWLLEQYADYAAYRQAVKRRFIPFVW